MKKLKEILENDLKRTKIIDKEGNPLLVYHGSISKDIKQFNPNIDPVRPRSGPNGIYFTSNLTSALNYTRKPGAGLKGERGKIYSAHLNFQNPLDITDDIKKHQKKGLSFGDAKRKSLESLKPEHDGVIFRGNNINPDEYIAFHHHQIKLKDQNK